MAHFLTDVLEAFKKHPDLAIFKRLVLSDEREHKNWVSISYAECQNDIERAARHWHAALSAQGVASSDVVGLWLTGRHYADLLQIYGISRAGFVPQVFSVGFSSVDVVDELLRACNGKVLLYDPSFSDAVAAVGVPHLIIPAVNEMHVDNSRQPLPPLPEVKEDDMGMIFHTSGTTSGRPKPIPETHRWLKGQQMHWKGVTQGHFPEGQDVYNQLGSFAHLGSATLISHLSVWGQCAVQTSRADFDVEEFLALVKAAGLNRVFLYAPWLSRLIKFAKADPVVLETLQKMRQIIYTGASINPDDEAWMVAKDLPVTLLYATTEACLCLISHISEKDHLPAMRIISSVECEFIPTTQHIDASELTEGKVGSEETQLYELFIPAHSRNCPHPSVRNRPPEGHVTGDLFEEVTPGRYVFRGRNDDWIRTGKQICFCDTKSIEDNVLSVCSNLVRNCTVVGHNKPHIVLFVEPVVQPTSEADIAELRAQILELTAPFRERLFVHERIAAAEHIVVVPSGSLSRTKEKGNIRRKAVEDEFAEVLKSIYAVA
ncbi:acetyl-CoA synthetase-like protein [Mycena metata]|uniref:Acetyl-CoA synthetase-like protein n=1 Tax=Mycena metata TaxID=1033252 RepID=A0AAD7IAZ7_9AGAR|nr:acetyl-CoA synthetase-like protein [Mycena metata]